MNSEERLITALEMRTPDRVPVFYQHLGGARQVLKSVGSSFKEGFESPEAHAKICLESHKMYGFDNVMAGWGDTIIEAHAFGTEWKFPERDFYPMVDRYGVVSINDVDELHAVDPMEDKYWSVPLKAAKILLEKLKGEVAVVACIDSPFVVASNLRGYENLLMDLLSSPNEADKMLRTVTESEKMFGDHLSKIGVGSIFIENGTAGATQNSPELCGRYDLRYVKETLEHYRKVGVRTILHNCAEMPYLEDQVSLGPDCIHFNDGLVNMEETFDKFRGRTCVMAGVDHQKVLFKKTPAEVEQEVKRTIDMFGKAPGLIIAPGCEMPFKTPIENIQQMISSVKKYGTY